MTRFYCKLKSVVYFNMLSQGKHDFILFVDLFCSKAGLLQYSYKITKHVISEAEGLKCEALINLL